MEITKENLKTVISGKCGFVGNEDLVFKGMNSLDYAEKSEITWIKPNLVNVKEQINSTKAGGIICDSASFKLYTGKIDSKLFIISESPKLAFVETVRYIYKSKHPVKAASVHHTAIIDPQCSLGTNVSVGAYCIIGNCIIGDETIISDHVKIFDDVVIGKNCLVREFCSIGGEGFGFIKTENNYNEHIPHIGSVVIGDNVEIYPFSNVDRGTLGKTEIKKGTVIDHYAHIGHNTTVGENNIIAAGTILAGGSSIKDNCFIGVHTIVKEKCVIGSNVITGMGSVVIREIPSNTIVAGNPAKFLKPNV